MTVKKLEICRRRCDSREIRGKGNFPLTRPRRNRMENAMRVLRSSRLGLKLLLLSLAIDGKLRAGTYTRSCSKRNRPVDVTKDSTIARISGARSGGGR